MLLLFEILLFFISAHFYVHISNLSGLISISDMFRTLSSERNKVLFISDCATQMLTCNLTISDLEGWPIESKIEM